jgi:SNF2 family DNA or RNA helicase
MNFCNTSSRYALSKSTTFRYLLTGTPFNNCISDVATLSWLLQDGGAWQDPKWWRQMEGDDSETGRSRLESESVQANLRAWRASLLIRGKDRISQELPARNEFDVDVQATGAEKKYSAALFIKFHLAIMEHDKAARQERNRFLAWSHILTTLLRMMQMTTHRLISTKDSRNFTHHYSRLSNYKHKPNCVNCQHFPDDIPLVQRANAVREFQAEDWLVDNGDSGSDGDSDEHNANTRSRRAAAANRISPLPCGHNVCTSCMQKFGTDPVLFPCQFCVDMREIGMEMDHHYSSLPPPSSKLTALLQELKKLSQYRAWAPQPETKKATKDETPKQETPKRETVEKAVVFTLFKATLDICEALLRDAGITHVRIDGDMKVADRSKAVATFLQDESVHVLLASSRSAGLGLNLCRATTVIFLDRWSAASSARVNSAASACSLRVMRRMARDVRLQVESRPRRSMRRPNPPHRTVVSLHNQTFTSRTLDGHGFAHDSGYPTHCPLHSNTAQRTSTPGNETQKRCAHAAGSWRVPGLHGPSQHR